ncbi:Pycsar system effector family protein [Actinomycetota bacterium Odt1-20B]
MTDRTDLALDADLAHVSTEIARADQKAALLIGLAGAGLAVVAAAVRDYQLPVASQVIGGAGVAAFLAAIVTLLLVVRPNTSGGAPAGWPRWATCTPEQVLEHLAVDQRAERLCRLSRLCARKMRGIRHAVHLLLAGTGCLTVAALIAATLA